MLKIFFVLIVYGSIYSECSAQHLQNLTIRHQVRVYDEPSCHCNYASFGFESGGCYIAVPAPQGYHCQCLFTEWEWTCRGKAHKCSSTSECPSDCTSVFCCHAAAGEEGNCGGYKPKMSAPGHPYSYDIDLEAPGYLDPNEQKLLSYKRCMQLNGIPNSRIIDKKSSEYNTTNFQWNKWFEHTYPVAYFQPTTVLEVQKSINCGRNSKLPQVPNSGAHSYSSLSFGNDDSLILDMRKMNSISIDTRGRTVTVQPGALLGRVNSLLWKRGGFGTPLGNCMTVGMGGHAIGGGIGYFSGLYGLALDNLVELTMVDASARPITVNPTTNRDLWWAMRGVGPGYIGVVTSYKLKLFQASNIKLTYSRLRYAVKDFARVMEGYTKWLEYAEKNIRGVFTVIFVVSDNFNPSKQPLHPGVEVQLLHIQDPVSQREDNRRFLQAYPKFFPTVNTDKHIKAYPSYMDFVIRTGYAPVMVPRPSLMGYPGAPPVLASMGRLDDPLIKQGIRAGIYDDQLDFLSKLGKDDAWPRYFKAKSFYVKKHFDANQLRDVQAVLQRIPKQTMGLMITSEGGAIGRPRATDMAYVHRDVLYNIRIHFEGTEKAEVPEGKAWFKDFWNVTRFMDGGETYQNYPDLEVPDYLKRFYGQNLQRLIDIKRKWDPLGYFTSSTMSLPIR